MAVLDEVSQTFTEIPGDILSVIHNTVCIFMFVCNVLGRKIDSVFLCIWGELGSVSIALKYFVFLCGNFLAFSLFTVVKGCKVTCQ